MDFSLIEARYGKVRRYILIGIKSNGDEVLIYGSDNLDRVVSWGIDEAYEYVDAIFLDEQRKIDFIDSLQIWDTVEMTRCIGRMEESIKHIKNRWLPSIENNMVGEKTYYFPTISCHTATNMIMFAKMNGNSEYANMIAKIVIEDIKADLDLSYTNNEEVKSFYYDRFYSKLSDCNLIDGELLRELKQIWGYVNSD